MHETIISSWPHPTPMLQNGAFSSPFWTSSVLALTHTHWHSEISLHFPSVLIPCSPCSLVFLFVGLYLHFMEHPLWSFLKVRLWEVVLRPCISENVFILLSHLIDGFAGYRILGWKLISANFWCHWFIVFSFQCCWNFSALWFLILGMKSIFFSLQPCRILSLFDEISPGMD